MQRTWLLGAAAMVGSWCAGGCETRSVAPVTPRSAGDVKDFATEIGVTTVAPPQDSGGTQPPGGDAAPANPVSSEEPSDGAEPPEDSPPTPQ